VSAGAERTRAPIAWRHWSGVAGIVAVAALVLHLMGRLDMCACGTLKLWVGNPLSAENSQQLTDWYTATHVLHGLLFYVAARYLLPGWSLGARLLATTTLEAAWEVFENTAFIIDRYREVTVSLGYYGDSVINSTMDIAAMVVGFLIAARAPVWASITLFVASEAVLAWFIRDNLTLNILMLVWPLEAIRAWQAGG
jgi:hypothetical protein